MYNISVKKNKEQKQGKQGVGWKPESKKSGIKKQGRK
jgi:hypothetical protein